MTRAKFQEIYIAELQELRSAEAQLVEALPRIADQARHAELKEVLRDHLEVTRTHLARLEDLLRRHGADPRAHVDQALEALLRETGKLARQVSDPDVLDAELIGSVQRIEHYEIAAYGTVATYAKGLGLDEDLQVLLATLEEEKEADSRLTDLAKDTVNRDAAAA